MVKVMVVDFGVRGDGQGDGGGFWCEGPIAGARPRTADAFRRAHRWQGVRPTTGGHASPRPPTSTVLLTVVQGGGPGPERELTGTAAILLRSSATRSSLITILLLQPVFFLRPWARRKLKTGTGNGDGQ